MLPLATILHRNHVVVSGKGEKTIVFSHGFGCDQSIWRRVAPAFEAEYRVVLFDLVGAGQSDLAAYTADRYSSLDAHAVNVLEVLEALDLHNVVFVGHSVSGMIGLLAAHDEPARFDSLVMVNPSPRYISDEDYCGGFVQAEIDDLLATLDTDYLGWVAGVTPVIMANADRPELAQELRASFGRTDATIARHFARVIYLSDHRADLARTVVPTLVVQSSHDAVVPVSVGEYLCRQIPGSCLRVINSAGHVPHLSDPALVIAAIREFLATQPQHAPEAAAAA